MKNTIIIRVEPGELVYDILKEAYNMLIHPRVEKVIAKHNGTIIVMTKEEWIWNMEKR